MLRELGKVCAACGAVAVVGEAQQFGFSTFLEVLGDVWSRKTTARLEVGFSGIR